MLLSLQQYCRRRDDVSGALCQAAVRATQAAPYFSSSPLSPQRTIKPPHYAFGTPTCSLRKSCSVKHSSISPSSSIHPRILASGRLTPFPIATSKRSSTIMKPTIAYTRYNDGVHDLNYSGGINVGEKPSSRLIACRLSWTPGSTSAIGPAYPCRLPASFSLAPLPRRTRN
jgi:hypothetical protein